MDSRIFLCRFKAIFWLLFLLLCFFPCLFICVSLWIKAQFTKTPLSKKSDIKTVLITGAPLTKALHIARTMGQSGHRVIVAEQDWKHLFSLSRFSHYVKKFVLLPNNISYENALVQLWENEGIDCFLPISHVHLAVEDTKAKTKMQVMAR